jgi:hypothetical protein
MLRRLLHLSRILIPAGDRHWLDALESELEDVPAEARDGWLSGAFGIVAASAWRGATSDPLRLALAMLVGLLMSSGDGLWQLQVYVGIAAFFGFLKPHWFWRFAVLVGLLPHLLGAAGIGPMSRLDVPLPVMPGTLTTLIACWLGGRYDAFHRRRELRRTTS